MRLNASLGTELSPQLMSGECQHSTKEQLSLAKQIDVAFHSCPAHLKILQYVVMYANQSCVLLVACTQCTSMQHQNKYIMAKQATVYTQCSTCCDWPKLSAAFTECE